MPISPFLESGPLDPRTERPAFYFRVGVIALILLQGILLSTRLFSVPHDRYLLLAAGYAGVHICWWSLIAFGQRSGQPGWYVPAGQSLGLLSDLALIGYLSATGPDPQILWVVLLLPWAIVAALNRHLVASLVAYDTMLGLAGIVLLLVAPIAGSVRNRPANLLLLGGSSS